jgi:hypothetical protein
MPYFHNIEHMILDDDGWLRWKGQPIEHFEPDVVESAAAKGKARLLAARCRHLEEIGEPVNKLSVILKWGDRVKQTAGAGKGR